MHGQPQVHQAHRSHLQHQSAPPGTDDKDALRLLNQTNKRFRPIDVISVRHGVEFRPNENQIGAQGCLLVLGVLSHERLLCCPTGPPDPPQFLFTTAMAATPKHGNLVCSPRKNLTQTGCRRPLDAQLSCRTANGERSPLWPRPRGPQEQTELNPRSQRDTRCRPRGRARRRHPGGQHPLEDPW